MKSSSRINIGQTFYVSSYPRLLKALLIYIVLPIIIVYTAILYAYFARIIITWQWPAGIVAQLVLWYAVMSAIVLFMISPISDDNRWVKMCACSGFRKL